MLVGASMPSVLVEVSFLTHKQEGRLLGTGAYRQRIAEAMLDGVRRYLRTLKRAATDAADAVPPAGDRRSRQGYNSSRTMFGMQPVTPVIVKVVSEPDAPGDRRGRARQRDRPHRE